MAQAGANAGRKESERIETRIGVHLGDVIVQDYHVYGDGVNIAARLQMAADLGTICVSEAGVIKTINCFAPYEAASKNFEQLSSMGLRHLSAKSVVLNCPHLFDPTTVNVAHGRGCVKTLTDARHTTNLCSRANPDTKKRRLEAATPSA